MVCLGIPTLRPLYLRKRGLDVEYGDKGQTHATDPELPLFTMCEQPTPEVTPVREKPSTSSSQLPLQGPGGHGGLETQGTTLHTIEEDRQQEEAYEPTSFLRDSSSTSSSHTMVEPTPSPEPYIQRPESVRSRDRSNSIDDILGLYDSDRSRSRGRVKTPEYIENPSVDIWIKNEVEIEHREGQSWPLRG